MLFARWQWWNANRVQISYSIMFSLSRRHISVMASHITCRLTLCATAALFELTSKWTPNLRVTGLLWGKSPVTRGFPHKGPVMRKRIQCNDIIVCCISFRVQERCMDDSDRWFRPQLRWRLGNRRRVHRQHQRRNSDIYRSTLSRDSAWTRWDIWCWFKRLPSEKPND